MPHSCVSADALTPRLVVRTAADVLRLTVRCAVRLLLWSSGGISQLPLVRVSCVTPLAATDPAGLSQGRSEVEAAASRI